MRETGFLERLREFIGSRRFVWTLTILLGVVVVLYFLFVTFFFNPFEDDLEDTAAIVPQEVDYFLRWQDAGASFDRFPVPRVWSDFTETPIYQALEPSGELRRWGEEHGVEKLVADLEQAAAELPAGLSLQQDLLREVALAGNGVPSLDGRFDGLLMLRVSFKVKAGVAMLNFGFVRSKLPAELQLASLGGGRYEIKEFEPFGFRSAYLTRMRDVLLLATSPEWLDRARELQIRGGEESLAHASRFHDNVTGLLAPGSRPVEVFLRWDAVRPMLEKDPSAETASSFWSRLPAALFSSDLPRYAAGFWLPGERFEGRFAGEIDTSKASEFQRAWYDSQSLAPAKIQDFAEMIPGDSFLYAALAGDVGRWLWQLYACLDSDLQRLLDDTIVNAGKYKTVKELVDDFSNALSPGVFVGMRRFDYPPSESDTPHDDAPYPVIVVIANLRSRDAYQRLQSYFETQFQAGRLGAEAAQSHLQSVTVTGGYKVTSFASAAIRGTGEIVVMEFPARNAVVISNSYRYLEHVIRAALTTESAAGRETVPPLHRVERFQQALEPLERTHSSAKAFVYFDPGEARHWLDRLAAGVAPQLFQLEQERAWNEGGERAAEERRQRELLFPGGGEPSQGDQNRLRDAVDQALLARKDELAKSRVPELRAQIERRLLPLQLFDWVSVGFQANRKDAALLLGGRLQFD